MSRFAPDALEAYTARLFGAAGVDKALRLGIERVAQHGVFTAAIRRNHHIGCLAAMSRQVGQ